MTTAVGGGFAAGITVAQVLRNAPFDALDNRLLVGHCLRLSREQLITRSEQCLSAEEAERLAHAFARRQAGEPVAYILGSREFFGLSLRVTPAVLIPRADTELLVELALERAAPGARVADFGTGSGAIAIALARFRSDLHVTAVDVSADALEVARENAALHRVKLTFILSDWYAALEAEAQVGDVANAQARLFDMIVANPPYIVAGDVHLAQGDLPFEPLDALTDHADGLSALRILIAGAPRHLAAGSWLLLEHGYDQAAAVRALLAEADFHTVDSWRDLSGIERVSGGRTHSFEQD